MEAGVLAPDVVLAQAPRRAHRLGGSAPIRAPRAVTSTIPLVPFGNFEPVSLVDRADRLIE